MASVQKTDWSADERKLQSAYGTSLVTPLCPERTGNFTWLSNPSQSPILLQAYTTCPDNEQDILISLAEDVQSGKYKLASAEVTRFLKKSPRSQPALLLRAYLLTKLGGTESEVLQTWQSVERTGELSPRGMWWADVLMRTIGRCEHRFLLIT